MTRKMLSPPLRLLLPALCFGIVLALNLTQTGAANTPATCGANERACRIAGSFSGVEARSATQPWTTRQISAASSPDFGALLYDPDLKTLEEQARIALQRALGFREAISPYQGDNDFNTLVRQLDATSGFSAALTTPVDGYTATTLNDLIEQVEADLQTARDIYAFLLVYAPEAKQGQPPITFRADSAYTANLCSQSENPVPADPENSGQVLPPIIDWCDFHARLRQSVREAANIRMIYGQEFKVDALGVNFSASTAGGEALVLQEVASLRAAKYQFEQAEALLTDALSRSVGSGCLIADFFTQSEWGLLSRSAEEQSNVQYLIATRLSYLGAENESQADARENAKMQLRATATDQYIKLINMAGVSGSDSSGETSCAIGERPDGALIADMATRILETQRQSQQLDSDYNIFGFDVTMTPARHYKTVSASRDVDCSLDGQAARGLWDQAMCAALAVQDDQDYQEQQERDFDAAQGALLDTIEGIQTGVHASINGVSGCDGGNSDDEALTNCVTGEVDNIQACVQMISADSDVDFATCVNELGGSEAQTALFDLRSLYLEYQQIELTVTNMQERIDLSNDRNATVTQWLYTAGTAQTVADVAAAIVEGITCVDHDVTGIGPSAAACGIGAAVNVGATSIAGSISTNAEVSIANAEHKEEVENMLLDMTEMAIEARSVNLAYFAAQAEVLGMVDDLEADLREALRQRAWLTVSPANEPSFRIMRDSARLRLVNELEGAAQLAYLAARRAEYEYAFPLYLGKPDGANGGNFRISDIYRARTARDIVDFLNDLAKVTNQLEGDLPSEVVFNELPRISVAKSILLLTDAVIEAELIVAGNATPTQAQIDAERIRQFRLWVADHTTTDENDNEILAFDFQLSAAPSGLFERLLPASYTDRWLYKLGGHGTPRPENTGVAINLVTAQSSAQLTYRAVELTQSGMTQIRSQAGCTFDFNMMKPAAMLGFELPTGQNAEETKATFSAPVNEQYSYPDSDMSTPLFNGFPVAANRWRVRIKGQSPGFTPGTTINEIDMDLQQLEDIQLLFSGTRAASSASDYTEANPFNPGDCARIDW